ncbi:MAG: hypothetical protein HYZ28_12635 [Myxococcales bacterium]|nr:hypothetical protein [Myxococcales bacterium]
MLAVLLAATTSRGAARYSLLGSLGGGHTRSDIFAGQTHTGLPSWIWNASVSVSASPFRLGLLSLSAGVGYSGQRSIYSEGTVDNHGLGYRAGLSTKLSALSISLTASRDTADFLSNVGTPQTGSTLTTSYVGNASLLVSGYPSLSFGISRVDTENLSFGSDPRPSGRTNLQVSSAHSTSNLIYAANYGTGWNTGLLSQENFRSHGASLSATAALRSDIGFGISEHYYLRLPTHSAPDNPRYDDNAFNTSLQWKPGERLTTNLGYSYRHTLVTLLDAVALESRVQTLAPGVQYRINPETVVSGSGALTYTAIRGQPGQLSAGSGQQIGSGIGFRKSLRPNMSLNLGGNASVGLGENLDGNIFLGYGLGGNGSLSMWGKPGQLSVTYSVAFSQNLGGVLNSSLIQQGSIEGQTFVSRALLSGALRFYSSRRDVADVGTFLSRTLAFDTSFRKGRYSASFNAGSSEGLDRTLQSPISDGLFLPAGYNSHARYAALTSGVSLFRDRLGISGTARTVYTRPPSGLSSWEHGFGLNVGWSIGAFGFSLSEQLSYGGTGDSWRTANLVMLQVSRGFGLAF